MFYKYNPFAAAYPSDREPRGKIFQPVIDFRTYVRAGHILLMFPLGIAYFVLLVVSRRCTYLDSRRTGNFAQCAVCFAMARRSRSANGRVC